MEARASSYEHPIPTSGAQSRLWVLLGKLERCDADLDLVLKAHGLVVRDPHRDGCCPDSPEPADTVTCLPRPDDGKRLWFRTSWGEWIEEADRMADAVLRITAYIKGAA